MCVKAVDGVVTTLAGARHGLETGDFVKFVDLDGMRELSNVERQVKVLTPFTFSIGDTSSLRFKKNKTKQNKNIYIENITMHILCLFRIAHLLVVVHLFKSRTCAS